MPDTEERETSSSRKRRAILVAAEDVFLRGGYLGTNMDEIAAAAHVSKQTVYKHFGNKEALFVAIVTHMTGSAGDGVHDQLLDPDVTDEVATFLTEYAETQLLVVLTPRLMQLRRLVVAEVSRFPELARVLYDTGPRRAMGSMATAFTRLADRGLLTVPDAAVAASDFNWLVMAAPVNDAMMLGDSAIPSKARLRRHAAHAVEVFLAAYGT